MSIQGVRKSLKRALEKIPGLLVYANVPDSLNQFPAVVIRPVKGEYHKLDCGDNVFHTFEVIVLVSRAPGFEQAQSDLDEYIGGGEARSFVNIIEAAELGTDAHFVKVVDYHDYGGLEYGGVVYLGCKFTLEVVT